MADWDTTFKDDDPSPTHSQQSSELSGLYNGNKENSLLQRLDSELSTQDSERELILRGGTELKEESKTESAYENFSMTNGDTEPPEVPSRSIKPLHLNGKSNSGTAKERAAKSPYAPSTLDNVSEEEITIPKDGNVSAFTADQMVNFFRCLRVDDRVISHLHRKNVDGKRFARLKESELEAVGMEKNAVVLFFKERSKSKSKKGGSWVL